MIQAIIFATLGLIILASSAHAIESPVLISPANNSTISSIPTFSWQPISESGGYNILIDNEPTVTSPYTKNPYYPTKPSYSPQTLNPGTYYWKVKAKDSNGNWGSFSNIWSFTLASSNPTPTPTPAPTQSPTPTPTPTTAPNSNIFVISNTPTQINSDQSFATSVNLSLSDKPNTNFYIKGAFKHPDKPNNYFGLTKVGEEWIKNSSSSTNQFPIKTDQSGNWSGLLEVKIDPEDSGYLGSGDYIFKIARYDPLIWSNEVTIHINNVEIAQESSSNNQTSLETTANPSPTTTPVLSKSSTTQSKNSTKIASVAGISKNAIPSTSLSSPSAEVKVSPEKQNNPFISTGIIFIIAGVGSLGYLILRKNETIYKLFRKRN